MISKNRVAFLRGEATSADGGVHPILEMSDDDLRTVIGGVDSAMASSTMTGSYNQRTAPDICCDITQYCCCVIKT